jgi:hypothetical protein
MNVQQMLLGVLLFYFKSSTLYPGRIQFKTHNLAGSDEST